MYYLILSIAGIAAFLYLRDRVRALQVQIREVRNVADEARSFKDNIISIVGETPENVLPNLTAYLLLKKRHDTELRWKDTGLFGNIPYDRIDWDALANRQKMEYFDLWQKIDEGSKSKVRYMPSAPLKQF